MKILKTISEVRDYVSEARRNGKSVGFVPTMGFLHDGHLSLVKESKKENDLTGVSIFVNPTQFGPNEDLDAYPKDFEKDCSLLEKENTDFLFYPDVPVMYPGNRLTTVSVEKITDGLCGASRPGHFDGVTTVVAKLFNIVTPDRSYFGMKDYQQLKVIKKMTEDLNMGVQVIGMPIIREEDGLAMSSRNVYLKPEERESALSLSRSFDVVQKMLDNGQRDVAVIRAEVEKFINSHEHTRIDYIVIADKNELTALEKVDSKGFVMALAVFVGKARLIDNKEFEV